MVPIINMIKIDKYELYEPYEQDRSWISSNNGHYQLEYKIDNKIFVLFKDRHGYCFFIFFMYKNIREVRMHKHFYSSNNKRIKDTWDKIPKRYKSLANDMIEKHIASVEIVAKLEV